MAVAQLSLLLNFVPRRFTGFLRTLSAINGAFTIEF